MTDYIQLDALDVLLSASLLLVNGALSIGLRLGLERSLAVAALRPPIRVPQGATRECSVTTRPTSNAAAVRIAGRNPAGRGLGAFAAVLAGVYRLTDEHRRLRLDRLQPPAGSGRAAN